MVPLDGRGSTQPEDASHHLPGRPQAAWGKAQIRPVPQRKDQRGEEGEPLRNDGGGRRPLHAPAEERDKKEIQPHVDAHRDDDTVQGDPGVAHPPENGRQGVIPKDKEQAEGTDVEVGRGLLQRRRAQKAEERPADQLKNTGKQNAGTEAQREHGAGSPAPPRLVSLAKKLAHQDIAAHGQPDGQPA